MEWLPKDRRIHRYTDTDILHRSDLYRLYTSVSNCIDFDLAAKLWFVSKELFESHFTRKRPFGWQTFVIVFAYHVQVMPQSLQRSELCQQTLSGESDMFEVFGKIPKMFKRFKFDSLKFVVSDTFSCDS